MQITVTDHNEWEGEDFSFILEVDENLGYQIERQESSEMGVELNTDYQLSDEILLNEHSDNGYMDRIGWYEINVPIVPGMDFYGEVFYKGPFV